VLSRELFDLRDKLYFENAVHALGTRTMGITALHLRVGIQFNALDASFLPSSIITCLGSFARLTVMGASSSSLAQESGKTPGRSSRTQTTITMAVETITILKGFVPFEPAQAALDSLCSLLNIAIVREPFKPPTPCLMS